MIFANLSTTNLTSQNTQATNRNTVAASATTASSRVGNQLGGVSNATDFNRSLSSLNALGGIANNITSNFISNLKDGFDLSLTSDLLVDSSIIAALQKEGGVKNLLNPEFINEIDEESINLEFKNVPTNDLLFEENTRADSFIQKNLMSIISNENKTLQTIELPNVLSHELVKLKNSFTLETNESSLFPASIYALKKDYFETIQVPNANRYFIHSEDSKLLRESYVENLNKTKNSINNLYDNVESILNESEDVRIKNNFANKLVDFYLKENISSSIGKIASIILDNDSVNYSNTSKNTKDANSNINSFFYSDIKENFTFLQKEETLNKVFEIIVSLNNANSSFIKDSSENKEVLNTDRFIGQSFLNLSLSLDGFFKDSISHSYWSKKNNTSQRGGYLNNLIDSREFSSIPIIKLDSILSIENNSDGLFNNFNNDIMNTLGPSAFNIVDSEFSSESLMLPESNDEYLNKKVYDTFKNSLFLTNKLPRHINASNIITTPVFRPQVPEIVQSKERFVNGDDQKIINSFFNPMSFPTILYKSEQTEQETTFVEGGEFSRLNTTTLGGGAINSSSFDTDINFIHHGLDENANILRRISFEDGSRMQLNKAKEILSGTKFLFFTGKSIDSNFNIVSTEGTGGYDFEEIQVAGFNLNKIKYISIDDSDQFHHGAISGEKRSIRKFIQPIDINIEQSAKRKFYIDSRDYKDYYTHRKFEILQPDSENDFNLKKSLKNFINNSDSSEIFNGAVINTNYSGLTDFFRENSGKLKLSKGFVLFKNTQNPLDANKITDKFITFDSNLTKNNEFLNDRVVKSSSTYNQKIEENTSLIIDDLKKISFHKNWLNISFNMRHNLYKLKERKLKRINENTVIDFLKSIKAKAKKVKKNNKNTPYLTLLYSEDSQNAIDNFETSPFLFKNGSQETFKKFDFSDTRSEFKSTLDYLIKNDNQIEDFSINSSDVLRFLSFYYTDSELKNSSTLLNYFYSNVINCLSYYSEFEQFYNDLAYDKLLADSLLNNGANDVILALIVSALCIRKNISPESSFGEMNKKTQNVYKSYLEKIYSYSNIQKQKSYTLRTVAFPNINCSLFPVDKNTSASFDSADLNFEERDDNTLQIKDHAFNFGVMPGQTLSYCFPFVNTTWTTNLEDNSIVDNSIVDSTNLSGECIAYVTRDKDLVIADAQKFRPLNNSTSNCEALYEFVFSNFYNYDSYLDTSSVSRGENNIVNSAAFNQENNIASIRNIVKKDKKSSRSADLNHESDFRQELVKLTQTLESLESNNPKDYENNLKNGFLCFKRKGRTFDDYCLKNITYQPSFKTFINKFIIEVLKFLDSNFEENIDKIDTIEEVTKYAKTFSSETSLITNLLEFPSSLFSIYFDAIIEGSIYKSISRHLNSDETTAAIFKDMWNKEIFDLINIEGLITNKIEFEKEKKKEENFEDSLFMQIHADIININKVLNNSDVVEIMAFDVMSSYFAEFEKSKNSFEKFAATRSRISKLEENLNLLDLSNSLFNKTKLNLLSKKLNDYSYFQFIEYDKINQIINSDFSLDLKDHFEKIIQSNNLNELEMFFSTLLKREKNKSILAEQGTALLNLTSNRYDIIRFGIDHKLAETLSDNKILKIKCHITNHKFPNIFIPPVYYFYTPVLTDITPSHLTVLEQSNQFDDGIVIDDFIGVYDFNEKDLKQRYNVAPKLQVAALVIMKKLLNNVNSERLLRGESTTLAGGYGGLNSAIKIVTDANFSNAVKYSNYKSQKNIDENNINSLNSQVSILGSLSTTLFETMTEKDFEETFLEPYGKAINFFEDEEGLSTKIDIIKNKAHFVEFFNAITEFIDQDKITGIFDQNKFFDVFSIVIGRDEIKKQIEDFYSERPDIVLVERLMQEDSFFDSFSYVIESEVV